jgi:hypothetical protein
VFRRRASAAWGFAAEGVFATKLRIEKGPVGTITVFPMVKRGMGGFGKCLEKMARKLLNLGLFNAHVEK